MAVSNVDHPSHYNTGRIEVIDFLEDQRLGFHLGNTVKYICRSAHKGKELEDLRKAAWYLNRFIENQSRGCLGIGSTPAPSADTTSGLIPLVNAKPPGVTAENRLGSRIDLMPDREGSSG